MHFNDLEKSKLWLEVMNPSLGNVTPIQMLKLGRYQKLMEFIYTSLEENKR